MFPLGGADACTPRQGVTPLYGPSICTRSVQIDLLRSQVLQPFPTPGSGTPRVAGESLRDRRVSCLPRWTVCPTRSPSLGPNRSTCRGDLIKKSTTWRWGPEEQQAFDELTDKVANAKCLGVPRAQGEIILVTDASNVGGG